MINNSTQTLIQTLLTQVKERDNLIENLTKSNELQGLIHGQELKKYKSTILIIAILFGISVVGNILLLF